MPLSDNAFPSVNGYSNILNSSFCIFIISTTNGKLEAVQLSLIKSLEKVPKLEKVLKITNSEDLLSVAFTGHVFRPYSNIGRHLISNKCK